jgi:hypothetical protein
VFLAVAQGDTREKNELASSVFNVAADSPTISDVPKDDRSTYSATDLENEGLFIRHLGALFRKRAANFKRDKRAWLCTTILPSLFVLIGFMVATFAALERDLDPIVLTLDDYNIKTGLPRNPIAFNSPGSYSCQPDFCAYQKPVMDSVSNPGSDELYYFCGYQARISKNETCSISESTEIMNRINDAGAAPQELEVSSLLEVRSKKADSWLSFDAERQY